MYISKSDGVHPLDTSGMGGKCDLTAVSIKMTGTGKNPNAKHSKNWVMSQVTSFALKMAQFDL